MRIATGKIHVFIMIAYFMTHCMDFANNSLVKTLRHHPEIVGADDAALVLYPRKFERVQFAVVHIMPEHDAARSRFLQELCKGLELVSGLLQAVEQLLVGQ